ncbi:hypothetical protein ACFW9O_25540 [Streptomyces sp. NPDC059499]|uniref:hypothetical protein n=1 Tax=Streptomyces sp. NPDC059499 TaxID=3346852 RepID=UPI0036AF65CD
MADTPEKDSRVQEEPQAERGPMGSRDTGSDQPEGGPVDRPSGTSDERSDTSVQPKKAEHPKAPRLQSGGG